MVQQMVTYYVARLSNFLSWLNSLELVSGVSLGAFIVALFIVGILIRSLLLTAR